MRSNRVAHRDHFRSTSSARAAIPAGARGERRAGPPGPLRSLRPRRPTGLHAKKLLSVALSLVACSSACPAEACLVDSLHAERLVGVAPDGTFVVHVADLNSGRDAEMPGKFVWYEPGGTVVGAVEVGGNCAVVVGDGMRRRVSGLDRAAPEIGITTDLLESRIVRHARLSPAVAAPPDADVLCQDAASERTQRRGCDPGRSVVTHPTSPWFFVSISTREGSNGNGSNERTELRLVDKTKLPAARERRAGQLAWIDGRYAEATSRLERVVDAAPGDLEARLWLAKALAASGANAATAKKWLERPIGHAPAWGSARELEEFLASPAAARWDLGSALWQDLDRAPWRDHDEDLRSWSRWGCDDLTTTTRHTRDDPADEPPATTQPVRAEPPVHTSWWSSPVALGAVGGTAAVALGGWLVVLLRRRRRASHRWRPVWPQRPHQSRDGYRTRADARRTDLAQDEVTVTIAVHARRPGS